MEQPTRTKVKIGDKLVPQRRAQIYFYIVEYKQSKEHDGNSPSYQEMADHFNIPISNVWVAVRLLASIDGLITFNGKNKFILNGVYIPPDLAE